MGHDTATFGTVLRQFRLAAALSQEELVARAGLSLRGLSDLERGVRRTPYVATVRQLADALGLSPEDRQALLAAARGGATSKPDVAAMTAATVPRPPTPLIGREPEVATLETLLRQPAVQLVTVTGPGGSGKTRLTIEVATRLQHDFANGVYFVDLSPLHEASQVLPAIAPVLGVREVPGETIRDTLARALAKRHLLLVLDNCEQVIEVACDIAALLASCPALIVLATSREPLRVRAEHTVPLAPLPLPDFQHLCDLRVLVQVPSVALFVERAQAVDPAFTLTEENGAVVAAICRQLDGLPLAIELAASRVRLLPPTALLGRLEQSLSLLTSGARDAPARQRTLRGTIAWSYDLLSPQEQALYRWLSVFVGGWTLDAARSVTNPDGDLDVLGGLAGLMERSLVQRSDTTPGEPRFALLETIREFGLEQLATSGEGAQTRERHAAWVLALAEEAEPQLLRAEQQTWRRQLEAERANIRAALAWFEQIGDAERAQRLTGALQWFGILSGTLHETHSWFGRALAIQGKSSAAARGWALAKAAVVVFFLGDYDQAWSLAEEGQAVSRAGSFTRGTAVATGILGECAWMRGDLATALGLGEEAISLLRELGDAAWLAMMLADMGVVAWLAGDRQRGDAWSGESLVINRALGNHWFIAVHLSDLGVVAHGRGDLEEAARHYAESVRLLAEAEDRWYIASPLSGLAAIAVNTGNPEVAACLLGVAAGIRETSGFTVLASEQERDEQTVTAVRAALGEEAYTHGIAAGRRLSIEQAVEEAVAVADRLVGA